VLAGGLPFFFARSSSSSARKLRMKTNTADAQKKIATACLSISPPDLWLRQVTYISCYADRARFEVIAVTGEDPGLRH
jgi:hypothetical protein